MTMTTRKHDPIHPGEVLANDFLGPMNITAYRLAKDIGITAQHIGRIIAGTRGVTADVALRLGRYFGTSPDVWMNLQSRFDLERAIDDDGPAIQKRVTPRAASQSTSPKPKRGRAA
jgi:antitoxin HigA-1